MSWIGVTVQEGQVHRLWLVVRDKDCHREALDRVADTVAVAAEADKVVVAVRLGLCVQK